MIPIPRSLFLIWLNVALALIVAGIGFGLGFAQGLQAQVIILYTIISAAVLYWVANYVAVTFENRTLHTLLVDEDGPRIGFWRANRALIISMALLLLGYLIVT